MALSLKRQSTNQDMYIIWPAYVYEVPGAERSVGLKQAGLIQELTDEANSHKVKR